MTLDEVCGLGSCVADLVRLPDREPVEAVIDLLHAETLGALSFERAWTADSETKGLFGRGWSSTLDIAVVDRQLVGPVPARPLDAPKPGEAVRFADGSTAAFDSDGRAVQLCFPSAHCTSIGYTSEAVTLSNSSDDSQWVRLGLDNGVVVNAESFDGRIVTYRYSEGALVSAADTAYEYDKKNRLTSIVGPRGAASARSFVYDRDGGLEAMIDRDGARWEFESVDDGILVTAGGDEGYLQLHRFDSSRRLVGVEDSRYSSILERDFDGPVLVSERRPNDQLELIIDGRNIEVIQHDELRPDRINTYVRDEAGRVIESTEDGVTSTFEFNEAGDLSKRTSAGASTYYVYDADGLLAAILDADGYRVGIERSEDGSIKSVSDGTTTVDFVTDEAGRVVSQRSGDEVWRAAWDEFGNVASTTSPQGATTDYEYDSSGRLVDGAEDGMPDMATQSVPTSATTSLSVTDIEPLADGGSRYRYSDGSVITYDQIGRIIETKSAGLTETRSYDDKGRLNGLRSTSGREYRWSFTAGGRTESLDIDDASFELDWDGDRLVSVSSDADLDLAFEWNDQGRLASTRADALSWDYEYDSEGHVIGAETPTGRIEYQWDENGRPTAIRSPNGATSEYSWAGQRLTRVTSEETSEFRYDDEGRLLASFTVGPASPTISESEKYEYDSEGRLISAALELEDGTVTATQLSYQGDRVSEIVVDGFTEQWQYEEERLRRVIDEQQNEYELDWGRPGVISEIRKGEATLASAEFDDFGNVVRVNRGDDTFSRLVWDGQHLASVESTDERLSVDIARDALDRIAEYTDPVLRYSADFDGAALESIDVDDQFVGFEMANGRMVRSRFGEVDDSPTTLHWSSDATLDRVEAQHGDVRFQYADERHTTTSLADAPDDSKRSETITQALFDDSRLSYGNSLPDLFPSIPILSGLPSEIGLVLPRPVSANEVIDAAISSARPVVPSPILPSADPEAVASALTATAMAMAGSLDLAVGPARATVVVPGALGADANSILATTPTADIAATIDEILAPSPSNFDRVIGGIADAARFVVDRLSSTLRFVIDNPITRAVGNVIFFAALTSGLCVATCAFGVFAVFQLADADSIADLMLRLTYEPIASLVSSVIDRDFETLVTIGVLVGARIGFTAVKPRLLQASCGLRRHVCIDRARFGQAASHASDAIDAGHPRLLRLDRTGASARRNDALRGVARRIGFDRDEYPPAFARRIGHPPSIRLIDASSNRALGSYMQRQTSGLTDGTSFLVTVL